MYTEIKYLNLLSVRLERFKQKGDFLWNFRCPICMDSQKHKNKARGFVFQVKGDLLYKCHNCQYSAPLSRLFETVDPALYKQYRVEKFQESNKPRKKIDVKKIQSSTPTFKHQLPNVVSIDSLNKSHPAKEYLLNRKLPTESLYYTEKFKEWTNSIRPGTFDNNKDDEPRIIIPFLDEEGNAFGYQGRSLSNSGLRYITIILQEDRPKIFGLDRVNLNETIYIVEGPLDSLLLPNSVAMAGADASSSDILKRDVVFIYDNEPRNKQIRDRISKCIHKGYKVVIWPKNIHQKDINDMILDGIPAFEIIKDHTYSGMMASLKLTDWKR